MTQLEIVTRQPKTSRCPTPLLFIHGAWHGAWCWSEHFLPYFAERGYSSHALSLRGHGQSAGREHLRWDRIGDYLADVAQVASQLQKPPIVVGHSLGGLVVQKYLEKHPVPAAVLLASVPVHGRLTGALRFASRHPLAFAKATLTWSLYPIVGTTDLTRDAFFSAGISTAKLNGYFSRLQDSSYIAFLDAVVFTTVHPEVVRTPILVMGGADDRIIPYRLVEATARAYHTQAEIFPGMAHDMMLEAGWQSVADRILSWLEEQNL